MATPVIAPEKRLAYKFREALANLERLDYGWNGYGAPVPNPWSLGKAAEIIDRFSACGIPPDAIAPSGMGGVEICFNRGNRFASFECYNSERMFAMTSDPKEPTATSFEVFPENVAARVSQIKDFIER